MSGIAAAVRFDGGPPPLRELHAMIAGLPELRERASESVLARIPNTIPGDALLFRLDAALQHRATPVSAGTKTAFAGWYFGGESYPALLRALAET